jgi:hypothetical protein
LAETGNTAIDDLGIDLAQALVIDAELTLYVRAEVFDDDVGLLQQSAEYSASPWDLSA